MGLIAGRMAQADAMHAVLDAAGKASAEKAKTGSWPTAPAADWPLDPCNGKPLRLRSEGESLRIWSVGSDLSDDDGKPLEKGHGDVVMVLGGNAPAARPPGSGAASP